MSNSITIGFPKIPEEGTGQLVSMFYDEIKDKFIASVRHESDPLYIVSPSIEMEPGELSVTLMGTNVKGWLTTDEMKLLFNLAKDAIGPIIEIGSFMGKSTVCLGWGSRLGNGFTVHAIDPHMADGLYVGPGNTGHICHENKGSKVPDGFRSWAKGSVGTFPKFKSNLRRAGIEDHVVPMKCVSMTAVDDFQDNSAGLIFIDGDHNRSDEDFDRWASKLLFGGYIALHDSAGGGWPLVEETVRTRILESERFQLIQVVDSITVGRKK